MNILFKEIYSLTQISETTLVAFGTSEEYIGILDYETMVDTLYPLIDDDIQKVVEIPGTRLIAAAVVSEEYIQVLSHDKKNPKSCKQFVNHYQFDCISCYSNRNLHQ